MATLIVFPFSWPLELATREKLCLLRTHRVKLNALAYLKKLQASELSRDVIMLPCRASNYKISGYFVLQSKPV